MKITRKTLLGITAGLGVLIIVYSLIRHFTSFALSEALERQLMDGIVLAALCLFMYNRKLASDERKAREAAERAAETLAKAGEEPVSAPAEENENLPHWERGKKRIE